MTALILGVLSATALALIEFGPHRAATRRPARVNRVAVDGIGGGSVRGARRALPVRLEDR
ncbi:hypothetical protein [Nocardia sp. NPDC057030]|uniref:hypothetical protein n=1 Tax=unclassified Nocardia TaxID=2637762 RepID=UPI003630E67C